MDEIEQILQLSDSPGKKQYFNMQTKFDLENLIRNTCNQEQDVLSWFDILAKYIQPDDFSQLEAVQSTFNIILQFSFANPKTLRSTEMGLKFFPQVFPQIVANYIKKEHIDIPPLFKNQ